MKRFISLILTLAMTLALFPATYVSATDYAGIRIEYPTALVGTQQTTNNYPGSGNPTDEITYKNSNGRVEWLSYTTNAASWNRSVLSLNAGAAGQYGAYKIRVPKAGKYDVTVQYRTRTGGAEGEMYILPITAEADIATALSSATLRVTVDFGTGEDETAITAFHVAEAFSWTADKADEYIVVWKAKEAGSLRPANLIFDGKGDGKAPINAESSLAKATLNLASGESTTITTTSVTMSDLSAGSADDIASLTYESSDINVVTVSGNTVTAAGEGTAKVYTKSGDLIIAENEITVIVPEYSGVRAQYPTNPTAYNLSTDTTTPDDIKYDISGKRVDWYAYTGTYNKTSAPAWNAGSANFYLSANEYAAYKINIPEMGFYNVKLEYRVRTGGGTANMYLLPGDTKEENIETVVESTTPFISNVNFLYSNYENTNDKALLNLEKSFDAKSAGEYIVVWMGVSDGTVRPNNLIFDGCKAGEEKNGLLGEVTLSDTELVVGESATATDSLNDAFTGASVTGTVAYSCDSDVISVNGTTVTANKAGTATLYAEVDGYGNKVALDVTVAAAYSAPTTINYGVFVNEANCASAVTANNVKLSDTTDGIATGELSVGNETLTVTATDDVSGYKFRYWVLGSVATGRYYSSKPSITVTPFANIVLTAIYTEDNEGAKVVDLFNYNGEFLKTLTDLSKLADEKPTMIGHTFDNKWLLPDKTELTAETELTASVTQAVAQYTKNSGYETENTNEDSAFGWTRNGKLVTYDEDYTFLTWLNAVDPIEKNTKEIIDKIPLVVLDENDSAGAYMIEYDKGEYEVVEAGILFGKNADPTVESATSKAKVSETYLGENAHGQMTAKPRDGETIARAYVMYKDKNDNNIIKVIYSK